MRTGVDLPRRFHLRWRQAGAGVLAVPALDDPRIEEALPRVAEEGVGRHASIFADALGQRRVAQRGSLPVGMYASGTPMVCGPVSVACIS